MNKNDEITLQIHDLHANGNGVGRGSDGRAVFIPNALPGESIRAKILKVKKNYAYGKLIKILTPSPDRLEGDGVCAHFGKCGGCQFQHYAYPAQLAFKEKVVRDAFARIAGIVDCEVRPIIGMDKPYHYRNKAQVPRGMGFYSVRSHRLVPINECAIQHPVCMEVMKVVQGMNLSLYDEESYSGLLRHLVVRVGQNTGEVMVIFVVNGTIGKDNSPFTKMDLPCSTIVLNENTAKTNVILGSKFTTIKGTGYIHEELKGIRYRISPGAFFQTNTIQTKVLYDLVADNIENSKRVIDAYCGIGGIALYVADRVQEIVGIESSFAAVEDAKYNAELNGINNTSFICGLSEELVPELLCKDAKDFDTLILDPPRKGCEASLLGAIVDAKISKIIYISCDPATLARDAKILAEGGYSLNFVQPVDMFPMTGHIEVLSHFSYK